MSDPISGAAAAQASIQALRSNQTDTAQSSAADTETPAAAPVDAEGNPTEDTLDVGTVEGALQDLVAAQNGAEPDLSEAGSVDEALALLADAQSGLAASGFNIANQTFPAVFGGV